MGKSKVVSLQEALAKIHTGDILMIPGFVETGAPDTLLKGIHDTGMSDLELVSHNGGIPGNTLGRLIREGRVRKLRCTHIERNKEAVTLVVSDKLDVEFIPIGTLCEQIRAAGAGLGTQVQEGKQIIEVDDESWLQETPIHADVTLLHAWKADPLGNLAFRHTAENYNSVMSTAADVVLVEAETIVPDDIAVSGCLVDCVIQRDPAYMNI